MPETLTGYLELISYHNEENDYTVARLRAEGSEERVTVVGHLSGVHEGEHLRLTGAWKQHPRFGAQFSVESYQFIYPETEAGIERYLASGLIRGIGPKIAERIVSRFGRETLEVIELRPEDLKKVPGLGRKKISQIKEAWEEQRGIRRLMIFLQSYGVSGAIAARIYRRYREQGVEAVSQNPYRLAEEVRGIGFATGDRIARSLGFAADSPLRIRSGLLHSAEQAGERGHTCLPRELFLQNAADLLELKKEALEETLAEMAGLGRLVLERDETEGREFVYSNDSFWAEAACAQGLARIMAEARPETGSESRLPEQASVWIAAFERERVIELSGEQKKAVAGAVTGGVSLITGGPGTGKTTIIAALAAILERRGFTVVLAAPTGRAAKKMGEAAGGAPAFTIHRLLGWSFGEGRFLHNAARPLKGDLFVIDEVSMVDLPLFASLLDALPGGARLVLVGDVDQLPSIGPGKLLADLIDSRSIPVYRLNEIFRQAGLSRIVLNAHRVRRGEIPSGGPPGGQEEESQAESGIPAGQDFFLVVQPEALKAREMMVRLAAERLEAKFGFDPLTDLQVITPMNRGTCGTRELNSALQEALNPDGEKIKFGRGLRVGDRVMPIRNDYEKDVFNGDVGRVRGCDEQSQRLSVDFDGRIVDYDSLELEDLSMAYAVTVHKSQGSEYPAVIIILLNEHYVMLQRNLLYTAISRGRKLVVLIGDPRAFSRAVSNARVQFRCTRLAQRLRSVLKLC